MTERPILFSAPMVRAILDGSKTQTRRVVKVAYIYDYKAPKGHKRKRTGMSGYIGLHINHSRTPDGLAVVDQDGDRLSHAEFMEFCPQGKPGDRLWVRETFCLEGSLDYTLEESRYPRDGRPVKTEEDFGGEGGKAGWLVPWYRATDGEPNIVPEDLADAGDDRTRWKPSIFMPRWASRIMLEVTEVRAQRLWEISEADAHAEGVTMPPDKSRILWRPKETFAELWDSINAERGYGWDVNPWVWAITFRRVNP